MTKTPTDPSIWLFEKLKRVTTSGRLIAEIDGLRFLAIGIVVVQHIYQAVSEHNMPLNSAVPKGWLIGQLHIGVELFFVISGFILALPFASHYLRGGRAVSLRKYYWRRVTRLEPPYFFSLLLLYFFVSFYYRYPAGDLIPHLVTGGLYVHNFFYHYHHPVNPVAWSLEVEVQFYVVAPLLAWVFAIQQKVLRRGAIVGFLLADYFIVRAFIVSGFNVPYCLPMFLPYFLIGFVVADMYCTDWNEKPQASLVYDAMALTGGALLLLFFAFKGLPNFVVYFCQFALVAGAFRGKWYRRFLRLRPVVVIGGMCYTIYLLHFYIIAITADATKEIPLTPLAWLNLLIYIVLFSVIILAIGVPAFLLVEKPCMQKDWPQKLAAAMAARFGKQAGRKSEIT